MAAKMPDIEEDDSELLLAATPVDTLRTTLTNNNRGLTQAYEIRDFAAKAIFELRATDVTTLEEQSTRAGALRSMTYVWQEASERIRILRGKPMPGSLRPVQAAKAAKKPSTLPTELPE